MYVNLCKSISWARFLRACTTTYLEHEKFRKLNAELVRAEGFLKWLKLDYVPYECQRQRSFFMPWV